MHTPSSEYHHGDASPAISLTDSSILLELSRVRATIVEREIGGRRENGRVSDLPPEIPNVTIRNFFIAVCRGQGCWEAFVVLAWAHASAGFG